MNYSSVPEVMRTLGISDWGKLGQGQAQKLLEMMLRMDMKTILKIMEQLPEFTTFIRDALDSLKKSVENLSAKNSEDSSEYLALINQTQATLERELDKENLDSDDKKYIINKMMELTEKVEAMDKDNKEFQEEEAKKKKKGIGVLAGAALALAVMLKVVKK